MRGGFVVTSRPPRPSSSHSSIACGFWISSESGPPSIVKPPTCSLGITPPGRGVRSSTTKDRPRRDSSYAVARPAIPPPMIATSTGIRVSLSPVAARGSAGVAFQSAGGSGQNPRAARKVAPAHPGASLWLFRSDVGQSRGLRRIVVELDQLRLLVVDHLGWRPELADARPVRPEADVEQGELVVGRPLLRRLAECQVLIGADDHLAAF